MTTFIQRTLFTNRQLKRNPTAIPAFTMEFGGHRYLLFLAEKMNWHDAQAFCRSVGGHLATITTQEESDWINKTFSTSLCEYWIGGTDERFEGEWGWVTGEEWVYTNWERDQPDNFEGRQHALQLRVGAQWDDEDPALKRYFLIEWDH